MATSSRKLRSHEIEFNRWEPDLAQYIPVVRSGQLFNVEGVEIALFPVNVMDVVLMGRTPYLGWFAREGASDVRIALQAMERTGTAGFAERPVGELSGGEQQRVLIARAIAQAAPVMLLDEPTAHLDLRHQDKLLKLVRELAVEQGLAVLIALHDLNLVARFTDRMLLLSHGTIYAQGRPEEVLIPAELERVYGLRIHVMTHPIHGSPLVLSAE